MEAWLALVIAAVGVRFSEATILKHGSNMTVVSEEYRDNAVEYSPGMFEGDINLEGHGYNPKFRVAMSSTTDIWNNGIVPYRLHTNYPDYIAQMIRDSLTHMQNDLRSGNNYCIRFVERTTERDYIYIQPRSGCNSKIGRRGGAQILSLGNNCLFTGTVKHEMIHALGFWHEQSRGDRDTHVTVNWANIRAGHEMNFEKHVTDADTQGQPYDILSIMHYDAYNFRRDMSLPTMVAIQRGLIMGQRKGLSPGNVREIQLKYNCPIDTSNVRSPTLPRTGSIFDCNFEADMCGITNEGGFEWERHAGPTPTTGTGPTADHTSGNGYYLYARASGHVGQSARFTHQGLIEPGTYCVMFQYWIYGASSMQPLKVGGEVNGRRQDLISVEYNGNNYWQQARLTLTVGARWRLYFEVTPNTELGDIAVDDMEMFTVECPRFER